MTQLLTEPKGKERYPRNGGAPVEGSPFVSLRPKLSEEHHRRLREMVGALTDGDRDDL